MAITESRGRTVERRAVLLASLLMVLICGLVLGYLGTQAFDETPDITTGPQTLLQMPSGKEDAKSEAAVLLPSFDATSVDEKGHLVVAGRSEPGWTVQLRSKSQILGEAKAGDSTEWVLTPETPLPAGEHTLSLLEIDPTGQRTIASAQDNRVIVVPKRAATGQALTLQKREASRGVTPRGTAHSSELALTTPTGQDLPRDCASARVKAGDTLWSIAHRCYGSGAKYTKILRSNRAQIRDPRLLRPDQRLAVPR